MLRKDTFAPGEWYHVYSRGIDKRKVYGDARDFERFLKLLYVGNDTQIINLELLKNLSFQDIFKRPRTKPIVAIGAYCLMENHPHLLLQEKVAGGITKFMRKIGTAYTMYFNIKYERIGNLMVKPFRAKRVTDDGYFRRVAQYIHLNPAELIELLWKKGETQNLGRLENHLLQFPYSSLQDYFRLDGRPQRAILDDDAFDLIQTGLPPLSAILIDSKLYYQEVASSFNSKVRGRPKKVTPFN